MLEIKHTRCPKTHQPKQKKEYLHHHQRIKTNTKPTTQNHPTLLMTKTKSRMNQAKYTKKIRHKKSDINPVQQHPSMTPTQ